MSLLRSLVLLATAATPALAQRVEPLAVQRPYATALAIGAAPERVERRAPSYALPLRVGLGIAGAAGGIFAGAVAGAVAFEQYENDSSPSGYDGPGLVAALTGAAIGGIVTGAVAASFPRLESNCGRLRRTALAILGGTAGAAIGGAIGMQASEFGLAAGYVVGSGAGSGLAAALCG